MQHEELPLNSAFRPFVEELKNDIGVSGMMFGVQTETGREFKYLDAPPQVKLAQESQSSKAQRARRQSRLQIQMDEARTTGAFRTRHSSVAHCETSDLEVQQEQQKHLEDSRLEKEEGNSSAATKLLPRPKKSTVVGVKKLTSGHRAEYDSNGGSLLFHPTSADAKEARRRNRMRKRKAQGTMGEAALRDDLKLLPPVHKILPVPLLRKFDSDQPDLAPRRRARPKVLIVDGNLVHLGACKHIYERYFEIVQCVPSADQAMDLLDHVVFDVVLIAPDLAGELSGLDLVDAIRHVEEKSRHSFRALIVSVFTAEQSKDQTLLDACFCSGMDRFLLKPAVLYVHLLCDLMVGGSSTDAFRRLALETQWVSHHQEMLNILGDDPNARAGVMSILQAEGTEEIQQRKVAALMDTDTDRLHIDGLHERQRKEELQRIVNATAQMKRRIVELEYEVEVLEEERARKAYTESRNLNTLLALETRLKEAERELHEKAREAQQNHNKAEDYRIDLKNLLDNGCVNAEKVAKAKKKVQHFQRIMEACTQSTMSHLDTANQRSWNNYYGDVNHRSHFEVAQYVPQFATDTSASWYRTELSELLTGVGASLPRFGKAVDDVRSKLHRFIEADVPDVDAIINVLHDQLPSLSRYVSSEVTAVKFAVETAAANMLIREIEFWKLFEDDEPSFKKELHSIEDHIVGLKARLYDRTHATQTEMFMWDHQTMKDLSEIASEMMTVSTPDAGLAVDMETTYPRLPDGSYSATKHAKVEIFYLPLHMQEALVSSPMLQSLVPFLPIVRGDVFMLDKTRRTIFAHVFERLEAISESWMRERADIKKQLVDIAALLNISTVDPTSTIADVAETIRSASATLDEFQRCQAVHKESRSTSPFPVQATLPVSAPQAQPSMVAQSSRFSSAEASRSAAPNKMAPPTPLSSVRRGQTPTTTRARPSPSASSLNAASTPSRALGKASAATPLKATGNQGHTAMAQHSPMLPTSHVSRSSSPSVASVAEIALQQALVQYGDAPGSASIDTPLSNGEGFIQEVPNRPTLYATQSGTFSYDEAAEQIRVPAPRQVPIAKEPRTALLAQLKAMGTQADAAVEELCVDDMVAASSLGEVTAQLTVRSLLSVTEALAMESETLASKLKVCIRYASSVMLQAKESQAAAMLADAMVLSHEYALRCSTLQINSLKSELNHSKEELVSSLRRINTAAPTTLHALAVDALQGDPAVYDALSPTRSPSPCANKALTPISAGLDAATDPTRNGGTLTPRLTKRGQPGRSHYIVAVAATQEPAGGYSQPLSPQPPASNQQSPTLALHGFSGAATPRAANQAPSVLGGDRPGTQGSNASTPWQRASPPTAQGGTTGPVPPLRRPSEEATYAESIPSTHRRMSRGGKRLPRDAVDDDHFLPLLPGRGRAVVDRQQRNRYVRPSPVFQGLIVEDKHQSHSSAYLVALSMQPHRSEGPGQPAPVPGKALADAFAKYGGPLGEASSRAFGGVPEVTPLHPKHLAVQRTEVSPTRLTLSPDSCVVGSHLGVRGSEPQSPLTQSKDSPRCATVPVTPAQPMLSGTASLVVTPTTANLRNPVTTGAPSVAGTPETRRVQAGVGEPHKNRHATKPISRHELLAELMS